MNTMKQGRYLLVLLLAILLGGLTAWIALTPPGGSQPGGAMASDAPAPHEEISIPADGSDTARSDASSTGAPRGDTPAQPDPEIVRAGEQGRGEGRGTQGSPPQRAAGQTSPNPVPNGRNADRPLSAHEQAELQRRTEGRAAHNSRVTSTAPAAVRKGNPLARSLLPDEWQKAFAEEGLPPPPMVTTQVAGKVMSPLSNEGIAGAKVTLLSFLPWEGQPGGPLYTVATELLADPRGEFKGYIPAPPKPPQFHAPVGMLVEATAEIAGEAKSFQVLAGLPVDTIRPGEFNQLGIFWAPEEPFDIACDATQFDQPGLKVVCTGELNPQRWHEARRGAALSLFGFAAVAPRGGSTPEAAMNAGKCMLRGTWDKRDAPFLTLMAGDKALVTRRCVARKNASTESAGAVPQPFEDMVFENSGYVSITGQCLDGEGAPVVGAVVHTAGDPTPVSSLSDASGWFEIANPGKATRMLVATHDDFVSTLTPNVKPGDVGVQVTFSQRKPVLWLRLRDRYTKSAILQASLKIMEKTTPPPEGGKAPRPRTQTVELNSDSGEFIVKAEWLVNAIVIEKVGYFPRTVNDPMALQAAAGGALDIELYPGRELNVRPRDYTAVQEPARWFPDSSPDSPGIYTAWSSHWIEWQIDFGQAPEPGLEGGSFDLLLGCTNQGIVDNQYRFDVEVWVDGTKKGNLSVLANSTAIQTARMKLGKLAGAHTVRLVWLNDKWIPDQLDANIRYASLQFLEQP